MEYSNFEKINEKKFEEEIINNINKQNEITKINQIQEIENKKKDYSDPLEIPCTCENINEEELNKINDAIDEQRKILIQVNKNIQKDNKK